MIPFVGAAFGWAGAFVLADDNLKAVDGDEGAAVVVTLILGETTFKGCCGGCCDDCGCSFLG